MKKNIFLFLFTFTVFFSNAQYSYSDFSIIKPPPQFTDTLEMLKTMPESVEKAMLESRAFTYYYYSNSDSSLYFGKRVEAFAKKNNIQPMLIYHHLFLGSHYSNIRGNYSLGLYYVNLAMNEAKDYNHKNNFIDGAIVMTQLTCYAGLGSFSKVFNLLKNEGRVAIKNAYIRENTWTPEGMLGQIYGSIKEYDSAIKLTLSAIKINEKMPKELKWGFPYIVLGDAYLHKKKYINALETIYDGFNDIKANNFEKDIAESYAVAAEAHLELKNYDSAIYYANAAYKLATVVKLTNTILSASNLLTKIYSNTKQIDSAFKYSSISNSLKDEITDKSRLNEIENITLNEEIRIQQKQDEDLRRKKLILGFSLFFIIGFTSLIIYNRVKQKEKLRKLEEDRKNNELRAARDLQLSLLPKSAPSRKDLDIATFIRSSTEVGGDYFDFLPQENGNFYSICGDATGHGVTSGMMVSITKAGLNGIDALAPNVILQKLNKVVKKVDLGTLRMSLNIAEIANNEIKLSSAAMPPIYLYKAKSNAVEEIMNSGLPLGGLKNEDFDLITRTFETGDVLIQLSDGLPEAPNATGIMYDYDRLKALIQTSCHLSATDIINVLIQSVDQWMEGKHNPDDITLVVIKKK